MSCDCIDQMNAKLEPLNTKLSETFCIPRDGSPGYTTVKIETEKIVSRGKGRAVLAIPSYCPFCGSKFDRGASK